MPTSKIQNEWSCNLDQTLATEIQNLFQDVSPYVHELESYFETLTSSKGNIVNADRKVNNLDHRGHYNTPTTANDVD